MATLEQKGGTASARVTIKIETQTHATRLELDGFGRIVGVQPLSPKSELSPDYAMVVTVQQPGGARPQPVYYPASQEPIEPVQPVSGK